MKFVNFKNNIVESFTDSATENTIFLTLEEYHFAKIGINIIDIYKLTALYKLRKMIPKKEKGAKKLIIEKPYLSDDELEVQLKFYWDKYEDAKAGLDVFEGQALILNITQEEYRQLVIQKGDEFILANKKIQDMIEMTRQLAEHKINLISNKDEYKNVLELLRKTDEFSLETPLEEIKDTWS